HRPAAGAGAVGGGAAPRGAEAGRQALQGAARLLARLPQQRPQAGLPVVAGVEPDHGHAAGGTAGGRRPPAHLPAAHPEPGRAGAVRMVVPWAHGFKSIKWLQRITLTNDYKANDTYAEANNDPDSYLKTMARTDDVPESVREGEPAVVGGVAVVGWPGLRRVE